MPNYRIMYDLSDLYLELCEYDLREYRLPFSLYILEAENPDEAIDLLIERIIRVLLHQSNDLETRILCRKVKKQIRIDRVECL
tara:strand:- start:98 stop:346 length:249 start_codon:yes stop_codon:yes gene_type:complete